LQKLSGKERIEGILGRYKQYENYLKYPGEWGERAFRAWLAFDLFHEYLKWPVIRVVFGETFDVLFVNDSVKPIIYLETKKPGRGAVERDAFERHIKVYNTLEWAIITDGYQWVKIDCFRHIEQQMSIDNATTKEVEDFLTAFRATKYLYGDK
jgi:hypothetical protein